MGPCHVPPDRMLPGKSTQLARLIVDKSSRRPPEPLSNFPHKVQVSLDPPMRHRADHRAAPSPHPFGEQ